jgi:hypothetical protein
MGNNYHAKLASYLPENPGFHSVKIIIIGHRSGEYTFIQQFITFVVP